MLDEITFVKSCGRTRNKVRSSYKSSHFLSISMIWNYIINMVAWMLIADSLVWQRYLKKIMFGRSRTPWLDRTFFGAIDEEVNVQGCFQKQKPCLVMKWQNFGDHMPLPIWWMNSEWSTQVCCVEPKHHCICKFYFYLFINHSFLHSWNHKQSLSRYTYNM